MSRFDYVEYEKLALPQSRASSLAGKAVRDHQLARNADTQLQEQRCDS